MAKTTLLISALDTTEVASALIVRIDAAFMSDTSLYEIIFLGNDTNQGLFEVVEAHKATFPVRITEPEHPLTELVGERVALLGDIAQYPPEALPGMISQLSRRKTVIVGVKKNGILASLRNFLASSLFGLPSVYTKKQVSQSKLIVLKKSVITQLGDLFDMPIDAANLWNMLLATNASLSYYDVAKTMTPNAAFQKQMTPSRYASAVRSFKRTLDPDYYKEFDEEKARNQGNGFYYKGNEYVTHNTLIRQRSAVERTTLTQRLIIALILMALLVLAVLSGKFLAIAIVSLITTLYFFDLLFNLFLIYRSFKSYSEISIRDVAVKIDRVWPVYTILCPLYKEAPILPQFIAAMGAIDYPEAQLEVLLLLEEDDSESITTIQAMQLPAYMKTVIVPDSRPKTKPKACNYGLLRATGEYTVIYDAEDIPDPLQLKKAVLAFEKNSELVGCIQAKLNYYNWNQNLLTRLFTLEYSLWFNLILTGLQSIKAPIPLGGTSNHFRTRVLRQLGGWDPFNVTEDADLGIRLAKRGLKTMVLDSVTLEEANSAFGNWLKQRSRWIKGYMQTYLVHMRDLREFGKNSSRIDMITFQLVIGGKVLSMLINPILWAMTLAYFLFRAQIGPTIESLYLTPVFYIGAISLVIGNFMYLYYYMMGAARQGRPELIIFALFVPLYWIMMSIAAYYALIDLIVRPFHWHKTKHGLHLKKPAL